MRHTILGLGSNCGNRVRVLRETIHELRAIARVLEISPLYESEALLPENAPADWNRPFLNLAVSCETELSPLELLSQLKSLEAKMGREPRGRWAPREIDIDILAFRGESFRSPELEVPHPALLERPFALLPFLDLARDCSPELRAAAEPWLGRKPQDVPFRTARASLPLCELVGIVNLTPDSFSDGGSFFAPEHAVSHGLQLIQEGASVLDLGAESTRPGATPVTPAEEWRRLEPVLSALRDRGALLSVDTRHPEVATLALQNGADWINDVTGFSDPRMIEAVRDWECELIAMHSLGAPADPKTHLPLGEDPVSLVREWCETRLQELQEQGILGKRLILDPGVGFGKTAQQSLEILRRIRELREVRGSFPRFLVGHSRKSFVSAWKELPASARDLETATVSVALAQAGVDYLRVHDVRSTLRALRAWIQVDGILRG